MIGHGKRVFEAEGMVEEIIAELKKGNLPEELGYVNEQNI
jgi:hypothetical protein